MISDEKQYEFITRRIGEMAKATNDGLKLFLPMFSAIVAGTIWLRLQIGPPTSRAYEFLSDALVVLLTAVCVAMVVANLCSWFGYRKILTKMTRRTKFPVPAPALKSAWIELVLCFAMGAVCLLFYLYNPFSIKN